MRVGIVSEWFSRGAGYVGRQYEATLRNQGCEVFIYARGDHHVFGGPEWTQENVHRGTPCRIGIPKAIFAADYVKWLKRVQPDIVLFNEQHWLPPVLWTRNMGIKTAAYVDYYTRDSVSTFEWYDIVLCNTERHFSVFSWHSGCRLVPWGTDINRFKPSKRPGRPLTFLHSAGWDPQRKGTEQVLRCWLELRAGTSLVIHSQADISEMFGFYAARRSMLSGSLRVLSGTTTPEEIYKLGDVYVYPTHLEGIGLTLVEAIASGLPVIVPDDGPMDEFCLDEKSQRVPVSRKYFRSDNYYWPCNDVRDSDLTGAMAAMTGALPIEMADWRDSCYSVAREYFDWYKNSENLREIFETLPIREVDVDLARLSGFSRPKPAKLLSLLGGLAAIIFGARKVTAQ